MSSGKAAKALSDLEAAELVLGKAPLLSKPGFFLSKILILSAHGLRLRLSKPASFSVLTDCFF